jgi:serine/threonine protein kinase
MSVGIVGQVLLDQFRVDQYIASGGMSTVFRVYDLRRNVSLAMKVLHTELAEDPHMFKRFEREARALQKLSHPNIVPFYGLYRTRDFAFLLERYIDGPTLKDILRLRKNKPLPMMDVLKFMKALCAALGYAHANRIVHCDIKPGNLMIDRGGNIYLTDFGVARHAESTTTTLGGAGTPAYMAPEQIKGEMVTTETDIYAVGVMLYEMLTGMRPFRGDERSTHQAGPTISERIRFAHINLIPPDPRSLNPTIPEAVVNIVLQCLHKDPTKRIQTTQDLSNRLIGAFNLHPDQISDRIDLSKPSKIQEPIQSTPAVAPPSTSPPVQPRDSELPAPPGIVTPPPTIQGTSSKPETGQQPSTTIQSSSEAPGIIIERPITSPALPPTITAEQSRIEEQQASSIPSHPQEKPVSEPIKVEEPMVPDSEGTDEKTFTDLDLSLEPAKEPIEQKTPKVDAPTWIEPEIPAPSSDLRQPNVPESGLDKLEPALEPIPAEIPIIVVQGVSTSPEPVTSREEKGTEHSEKLDESVSPGPSEVPPVIPVDLIAKLIEKEKTTYKTEPENGVKDVEKAETTSPAPVENVPTPVGKVSTQPPVETVQPKESAPVTLGAGVTARSVPAPSPRKETIAPGASEKPVPKPRPAQPTSGRKYAWIWVLGASIVIIVLVMAISIPVGITLISSISTRTPKVVAMIASDTPQPIEITKAKTISPIPKPVEQTKTMTPVPLTRTNTNTPTTSYTLTSTSFPTPKGWPDWLKPMEGAIYIAGSFTPYDATTFMYVMNNLEAKLAIPQGWKYAYYQMPDSTTFEPVYQYFNNLATLNGYNVGEKKGFGDDTYSGKFYKGGNLIAIYLSYYKPGSRTATLYVIFYQKF